mmetsp:Transcript_1929/g.4136  ORF Transcript_1929/g.4136 Transcript_1929/m.4136 type:complete len:523 (+) Transcript_1929:165-1733(+)
MDFQTLAGAISHFGKYALPSGDGQHSRYLMSGAAADEDDRFDYKVSGVHNQQYRSPFISPEAEEELLQLATNFLLYVALVIITIMVTKIYCPSLLDRSSVVTKNSAGSYIRMSLDQAGLLDNETLSFDEESDDGMSMADIEMDGEEGAAGAINRSTSITTRESYNDLLVFNQEKNTKSSVVGRLVFCAIALNITFITWGVLQERMLTRKYPRFTGEYFNYSYALVFTNRLWTLIMSTFLMLYLKPIPCSSSVIYEYSLPSISNLLSSWCSYEALNYLSFPAQTLFKAFKLVPVMMIGKFLGNKEYPQYDYIAATIIGVGISLFLSSTDGLNFAEDIHGEEGTHNEAWTGVMLLIFFLIFDAFTSNWQSRMFQQHRDLSMVELLFATNCFSTVLSLVTLIHTDELSPAISFISRHSEIHFHFFLFSVCSTVGQLLIFYTIKNFGAVVFALIMTTRILLSIGVSCVLYGHTIDERGVLGLLLVFGAIIYRLKRKTEGKQLIKWEGMADEDKQELVHEWHEHTDT